MLIRNHISLLHVTVIGGGLGLGAMVELMMSFVEVMVRELGTTSELQSQLERLAIGGPQISRDA
mgnify:CR=1 FL=1